MLTWLKTQSYIRYQAINIELYLNLRPVLSEDVFLVTCPHAIEEAAYFIRYIVNNYFGPAHAQFSYQD